MYSILVFVLLVAAAQAQIFSFGGCPTVSVEDPFIASSYTGTWYEISSYPTFFEFLGKCVTAKYTDNGDTTIGVENTMYNKITNQRSSIYGTAYYVNGLKGDLVVKFTNSLIPYAPYKILETDYIGYAVVYSCIPVTSIAKLETVWLLNRSRSPSASQMTKSYDALARFGISKTWLFTRDQSNCAN